LVSLKRHVGFSKTTRRFFHRNLHRSKKILPLVTDCLPIIFPFLPILLFESANFSKNPSSRARVRARITGVFAFLLSQVSQHLLEFVVFQVVIGCFKRVLTNALANPSQLY